MKAVKKTIQKIDLNFKSWITFFWLPLCCAQTEADLGHVWERVRNEILNTSQSRTSALGQERRGQHIPCHSANTYLACVSFAEPTYRSRCSLILDGIPALFPRLPSRLLADTNKVMWYSGTDTVGAVLRTRQTEGPHQFQTTCYEGFNQWGTWCQLSGYSVRFQVCSLCHHQQIYFIHTWYF